MLNLGKIVTGYFESNASKVITYEQVRHTAEFMGSGKGMRRAKILPSLRCGSFAALFTFGVAILSPEDASALDLHYETTWGHFTLATAELSLRDGEDHYSVSGAARTEGLLSYFFEWAGKASTLGRIDGDGRAVRSHDHEGQFEDETRRTSVVWKESGPPVTMTEPPPDPEIVSLVPLSAVEGTQDPFTVILAILDRFEESERCEGSARVWDGRRRYDLIVTHVGIEEVPADRPWSYSGLAALCRLEITRIGGFRHDPGNWKAPEEKTNRLIWLADFGTGRAVPVRAEIETSYGSIVSRLRGQPGPEGTEEEGEE